jgi:FemAB-related protein (PEP-CTERM system-associated)
MNAVALSLPRAMGVAELAPQHRKRWDTFVQDHPDGTFFHLCGWSEVLQRAFGHRSFYLLSEEGGDITGVLPLAQVRSRLFGNALISTPFCVYGGALAASDEARRRLEDSACNLAIHLGVDYLELRNRTRSRPEWPCRDLYVTFRKGISADPEQNLAAIPRKQRAMVRKGRDAGLSAEIDTDTARLYDLYSRSLRALGTPVFTRRYLEVLREVFGSACDVMIITRSGHPVAGVLSLYFRDEVLPYYGGSTGVARECAGNDFMYWELMRRAGTRGIRVFDFGRSKRGSGSYRFKTHWGFKPQQLFYEYFLVRAARAPDLSPANPRFGLAIEIWKRLPLTLTRWLGPPVARYLG